MCPKVLIVEDELFIAMATQAQLEDHGHEIVAIAPTVGDALDCIHRQPVDVAVLDVDLRGQPVRPVARELIARNIPFVFATASPSRLTAADGLKDAPVLTKPYLVDDLHRAICCVILADGQYDPLPC